MVISIVLLGLVGGQIGIDIGGLPEFAVHQPSSRFSQNTIVESDRPRYLMPPQLAVTYVHIHVHTIYKRHQKTACIICSYELCDHKQKPFVF